MEQKRIISEKRAEEWCRVNGNMDHYQVSAKDGLNVEQAIEALVKEVLRRPTDPIYNMDDLVIKVGNEGPPIQPGCSC